MTSALGVAMDARVLLSRGWTQPSVANDDRTHARDEDGNPCNALSPKARRWTLVGAIMKATESTEQTPQAAEVYVALRTLVGHTGESPQAWSNKPGRTQSEVVAFFDELIAKAQRRSQQIFQGIP